MFALGALKALYPLAWRTVSSVIIYCIDSKKVQMFALGALKALYPLAWRTLSSGTRNPINIICSNWQHRVINKKVLMLSLKTKKKTHCLSLKSD